MSEDVQGTIEFGEYGRRRFVAGVLSSGGTMMDMDVLSLTADVVVVSHRK